MSLITKELDLRQENLSSKFSVKDLPKIMIAVLAILSLMTIIVGIIAGEGVIPKLEPLDGGVMIGCGFGGLLVAWIFSKIHQALQEEENELAQDPL